MSASENWDFHGGILDSENFEIDGLNVWQHKWSPTGEAVEQATPQYPTQPYKFSIYEMLGDGRKVRFGATELSNSVWGFLTLASSK